MSHFGKAITGGILALIGVLIVCAILSGIGFEATGGIIIVFALFIGICTGLIIGKLDRIEGYLCTLISKQEKISCALKCNGSPDAEATDEEEY